MAVEAKSLGPAGRVIVWPGGEHAFRMGLGEIRALQESRGAGPQEVLRRLQRGQWRIDDVIDVVRLGLIGSGAMDDPDALRLCERQMAVRPLDLVMVAQLVLTEWLTGPEDDAPEKPEAGAETTPEAPPAGGSSPASTETAS